MNYPQVTVCENPEARCTNDADSPHGEGTTVCKQLFRTQKLLAMDQDGTMVVDTFKLPTACVCNYMGDFGLNLRRSSLPQGKAPPRCEGKNATQTLETPYANIKRTDADDKEDEDVKTNVAPKREMTPVEVAPCNESGGLCEDGGNDYPETEIRYVIDLTQLNMVITHV